MVHEDLVAHYASKIQSRDTNFGGWHTYSECNAYLDSLHVEYPDLISEKWSIGQSHEGRDLWTVRLSDNAGTDETGEPEILLDTMHHDPARSCPASSASCSPTTCAATTAPTPW